MPQEFIDKLADFIEDFQLYEEDDEPYRNGYRRGYYDALVYVLDWMEEGLEDDDIDGY